MILRRSTPWIPLVLLSFALTAASSCNSGGGGGGSYPTSPGGGGGTTAKELNSGNIGAGASYQHRFLSAGSFGYHCIYHSVMTGSVNVTAAAADTVATVTIASSSAPFPAASVKPGGRVVWTNDTDMTHTVTSN